MRLEILRGGAQPLVVDDASRVLVLDRFGNPVAVAVEYDGTQIITSHAGEGLGFTRILAGLGVNRTVVAVPARRREG